MCISMSWFKLTLQDCSFQKFLGHVPDPLDCYGNLRALQVSLFRKKFCIKPEEYRNLRRNTV